MTNEYVTIIASSAAEAMTQFHDRRLGDQGFTLLSAMGRHEVITVASDGQAERLGNCDDMVAATFMRRVDPAPTRLPRHSED
jgi:hypothetical protein